MFKLKLLKKVFVVAVLCLFFVSPAFSEDDGLSEALKAVERSTKKHTEVLTDLLNKVSEEARPSIEHAIAVSKRGRNIAVESVELARTRDLLEKASLHTTYAEKRLAEMQGMGSKGKPEFVETLAKDYESAIGGAMKEINRAARQGRDVSEALKAVERSTKKHTEVLTDLFRLGKVPPQAKPAIRRAIEVSKRGRNRAMDVLNKIQKGELPIGRPEGVGKPEGVGRPEGIGKPEEKEKSQGRGRSGRKGERGGRGR